VTAIAYTFSYSEGVEKFGYRIYAFCLMTNHIHLAIEVGEMPLSRIMQNLSFRFTSFMNRQLKRTGHLFQGRYKAVRQEEAQRLGRILRPKQRTSHFYTLVSKGTT